MLTSTGAAPAPEAPSSVAEEPVLVVEGLGKHFDGVHALTDVNLTFRRGEIHALVGENGAGKSTLIKILTGVHAPSSGRFLLDGEEVKLRSTSAGHHVGIVALYQELAIVPNISVAENIFLGQRPPSRGGLVSFRGLEARARAALHDLGQDGIDPGRPAHDLSPIQQTMVAIARAISVDAKVLILDEPTAALTESEISELFAALRRLRDRGVSIIYVSHRLNEVVELCDRVTVLRDGVNTMTSDVAETTIDRVIAAMIGRPQETLYPDRAKAPGAVMFSARGVSGSTVHDVTLEVRSGEILGIAGLAGSGRSQLLRLLAGAQRLTAGEVSIDGKPVRIRNVEQGLRAGIALVPEERRSQGLFLLDSIENNMAIANLRALSPVRGLVSLRRLRSLAHRFMGELRIKGSGPRQPVTELSGGNQQKVVLGKFLARGPRVLLLDEPTRGIDVGTKAEIYALLRRLADDGHAVIVVSSELPEVIGISDQVIAMREGRVVGKLASREATESALLSMFYARNSA
ncbi:MAG TPA: sugar ABC transporter ATP-binding protein [Pseudolysinimonas sp.]|nr:sugar ABC transporter ATP-binding protein [Pseudolysinimonas sp.]